MPTAPTAIELQRLHDILAQDFGLFPAGNPNVLVAGPTQSSATPKKAGVSRPEDRRFLLRSASAPVTLRVADRLDLAADGFVIDTELGTLGILHFLPRPEAPADPATEKATVLEIRAEISKRIGEAAYLRHLLLEMLRPGEPQHGRAPYAVEVVFVLRSSTQAQPFGAELHDIMREVALLHAIGVSLLDGLPEPPKPSYPTDRRRAAVLLRGFSWLLHHSRQWIGSRLKDPVPSPGSTATPPNSAPAAATPAPGPGVAPASSVLPRPAGFRRMRHGLAAQAVVPEVPGPPSEILLKHFRLQGTRRWRLDPRRMLHLVHGPNGSGKSSLVESLELVTSSRIDRLASKDHHAVLTNRAAQRAAEEARRRTAAAVMLRFDIATPESASVRTGAPPPALSLTWRVNPAGIAQPLIPGETLKAAAFRLNQDVVDLLAQSTATDRGPLLFETFFPESYEHLSRSRELTGQRDQLLAQLPTRLRTQFENATGVYDEERAGKALEWVQDQAIPWSSVLALLPLNSTQISTLLPLLPLTFESNYHRTGVATSWEPVLEAARFIDDSLKTLVNQSSLLLQQLASATAFFVAYATTAAVAPDDSDLDHDERLARWLRLLAATDLHQREHELLSAYEDLRRGRPNLTAEEFPQALVPALARLPQIAGAPVLSREARAQQLTTLRAARDAAGRELSQTGTPTEPRTTTAAVAPPLANFDLAALDTLATAGVFGRDFVGATPPLSEAVRRAFGEGIVVVVRQGEKTLAQIGAAGGFSELAARVGRVSETLGTLDSLRDELTGPNGGLAGTLQRLRSLRDLSLRLRTGKNEAAVKLQEQLQTSLGLALTEFSAMFTPARWAYDDIDSQIDTAAAKPGFSFVQRTAGGATVPAALRLNTAQISTFALAFFLLCHRARQHPLRLAILDDPFENMDELTVTAVARGLGRYLRLRRILEDGPDAWQLVLLLHGEQNVDRVRREVACATYLLPWLTPDAKLADTDPIAAERLEFVGEQLQDLTLILAPSPERVSGGTRAPSP